NFRTLICATLSLAHAAHMTRRSGSGRAARASSRNEDELLRRQSQVELSCGLHAGDAALHLNGYRMHVAEASFERVALEDCRRASFLEKDIDCVAGRIDLVRACLTELDPKGEAYCTACGALFPRL